MDKEYGYRRIFTSVSITTGLLFLFLLIERSILGIPSEFDIGSNLILPWFFGQVISYIYGFKVILVRLKTRNSPRKYTSIFGSKVAFVIAWFMQTLGTLFLMFVIALVIYIRVYM